MKNQLAIVILLFVGFMFAETYAEALALQTAGAAISVPEEYEVLSCIGSKESGKDLHIDTGVHPSETTRVWMRFQFTDDSAARQQNSTMGMIEDLGGGVYSRFHFDLNGSIPIPLFGVGMRNEVVEYEFSTSIGVVQEVIADASNSTVILDDEERKTTVSSGAFDPQENSTFWLFSRNSKSDALRGKNAACIRIFAAKLWDGGNLLRDLIPCERKADHALGMYDMVKGEFLQCEGTDKDAYFEKFLAWNCSVNPIRYMGADKDSVLPKVQITNITTGEPLVEGTDYNLTWKNTANIRFAELVVKGMGVYAREETYIVPIVAKLPKGYVNVEYVESTSGCEYVDLGLTLSSKSDLQMEMVMLPNQNAGEEYPSPFGARTSSAAYKMTRTTTGSTQEGIEMSLWGISYGTWNSDWWVTRSNRVTVECFPTKGTVLFSGNSKPFPETTDFAVDANAYIFAFNDLDGVGEGVTSNPVHFTRMRLFRFSLWEDGVLKRDLVPCKKTVAGSDDIYGFYDLVTKGFFGNASGSGAFTGGPEMPNPPSASGLQILFY